MLRGDGMKTVVYADILIILNFIINYLLLKAESVITGQNYKTARLIISSFVGSLFSLTIFINDVKPILSIITKIIYIAIIIFIVTEIKSLKMFVKHFGAFLSVNFIFSGIMLAINILLIPDSSIYNNGFFYFDVNILSLIVISVICYILIWIITKITKNKTPPKCIYDISIKYNGRTVSGKALFDSGNTLCDCFSGKPVVITEKDLINKLTDTEITEKMKNYRLIPFSTINGKGTLPAFMADSIEIIISGKPKTAENIYIGITDKKIISGNFSALIGQPFFDLLENKKN